MGRVASMQHFGSKSLKGFTLSTFYGNKPRLTCVNPKHTKRGF